MSALGNEILRLEEYCANLLKMLLGGIGRDLTGPCIAEAHLVWPENNCLACGQLENSGTKCVKTKAPVAASCTPGKFM
jgi:hypothetical protein